MHEGVPGHGGCIYPVLWQREGHLCPLSSAGAEVRGVGEIAGGIGRGFGLGGEGGVHSWRELAIMLDLSAIPHAV